MSRLKWDQDNERLYETGVKNGVLFVKGSSGYGTGVAWNGLTAVTESPSGAEATALYADDLKYLNLYSNEELGGTIEAYTYPEEFMACDGSASLIEGLNIGQQGRSEFAFCYKTTVGNDSQGNDYGYKLHIIYGCKASPSERAYATINDSPEAITFSWEFTTTPVSFSVNSKDYTTCNITIDSTKFTEPAAKAKLTALENYIYGTDGDGSSGTESQLPMPEKVYELLNSAS